MSNKGFPAHEWIRRFAGRMEIDREQRSNLVSEFDQLRAIADEMGAELKYRCVGTDILTRYQQLTNGETK